MTPSEWHLLLLLLTLNIFNTLFYYYYCKIRTKVNAFWVWEYIVSDNEFVFSNYEKYIFLWVGKFRWATFSSILTQNKVVKGQPCLAVSYHDFFKFMVSCKWTIQEKIHFSKKHLEISQNCYNHWNFQAKNQDPCHGNFTWFFYHSWKFHFFVTDPSAESEISTFCLFIQYPWKFHVLNPRPCLDFSGMEYAS